MRKITYRLFSSVAAISLVFVASSAHAIFNYLPNAFLSVDINGGTNTEARTQLGWDGTTVLPVQNVGTVPPAPSGSEVLWSPWGGPTTEGGDGIDLPRSPATGVTSISKAFGAVTATISIPGANQYYAQAAGTKTLDSRDRGDITLGAGTMNQIGRNMYRDFAVTLNNLGVRGRNYIQFDLTGLTPGAPYQVAMFSYDFPQVHLVTGWTLSPPPSVDDGYAINGDGSNTSGTYVPPAGLQIIDNEGNMSGTSTSGGVVPSAAIFTTNADGGGKITLYGFGMGDNPGTPGAPDAAWLASGNQSATYFNGFQIALVPEPGSLALVALGSLGLLVHRRRRA